MTRRGFVTPFRAGFTLIELLVVMAIIGGAIFTPVMGLISETTKSMAIAMLIPLGCYVFVAYYSYIGSKVRVPVLPAA